MDISQVIRIIENECLIQNISLTEIEDGIHAAKKVANKGGSFARSVETGILTAQLLSNLRNRSLRDKDIFLSSKDN